MKRLVMMTLTVLLALPVFAAQELVGRWEQVERPKGANAQFFEFREDGNMSLGFGASVDGTYKREGDRVLINTGDGSSAGFVVNKITETTLVRSAAFGEQKQGTLTRVGKPVNPKDPLIGTWSYEHEHGGLAYETLDADGTYHFRYPFGPTGGYYTVKGEKLALRLQDRRVLRLKYSFRDGKLILTDDLGKETVYQRALF